MRPRAKVAGLIYVSTPERDTAYALAVVIGQLEQTL